MRFEALGKFTQIMFDLTSPVPNETVCAKVAIEAVKFFVRELLMDMFNKVLTGLGYQATHTDASFLLRQTHGHYQQWH